ncbi:lipoprotein insertase outer membrane protein LolB [Shewanella benthica]|uniref:Outer-membrane lipoprotein LolB n=1 Tax=Shewanella benthica KT99 TaxID=314608 RepID=A9DBD1_9GAMM|nr:lipoprotein insertase outer membrane protein LolB [Shewanella benthica]EDQ00440.1 outer membrane lipoprotein LolB [Shewanella benthica KT99]
MNNLSYITKTPLLLVILSLSLLSACTTTATNLVPIQVDKVSQAHAWEMRGKLAVKTPKDSFSTNLYWLHTQTKSELKLTTMLGTTVLSLITEHGMTRLEVDGKTYEHHDAQQLLTKVTGWSIPVNALPLWITGQVSPDDEVSSFDEKNRPVSLFTPLESPPWQVEFLKWQHQSGAQIPRLLQLKRVDLRLKIQVNEWQALADRDPTTNKIKKTHQLMRAHAR